MEPRPREGTSAHATLVPVRDRQSDDPEHAARLARFQALYEAIAPSLYAWAEIKIRPQMRGLVDPADIVQEVWYRAWRSFEKAERDAEPFRRWIFRVAKNVLLESFRALRAHDTPGAAAGESARLKRLAQVPDSATAITRRVARDEGLKLFAGWTLELEEDDRALVVHLGLEDMDRAELATRLGVNEAALAKRWERLQGRLAENRSARELFAAVQ